MKALWKVGEFHAGDKIELCLATADKIEAYEKHESFVRWVYVHDGGEAFDIWYDAKFPPPKGDAPYHWRILREIDKDNSRDVWNAARAKTDAFKVYVHQRLDAMGVPHSLPESEHGVGGRLDWVEAIVKRYRLIVSRWQWQKTSESERFLQTLGIDGGDMTRGLSDILDEYVL